ncbi:hypothetical protein RF11_01463 [Thelohanellus kitauei]|uniref:Uncharacterized protein n=1 Tax=Thelohanellus kitauei TaxID=669202 RepID=A0A0C2IGY2_THEKT|nr:hypothetical protein RF11_01463 [Thelohanellus kitauei]
MWVRSKVTCAWSGSRGEDDPGLREAGIVDLPDDGLLDLPTWAETQPDSNFRDFFETIYLIRITRRLGRIVHPLQGTVKFAGLAFKGKFRIVYGFHALLNEKIFYNESNNPNSENS